MGKLDGKVAIVTGSGQGVGRGIAIFLAREGAKVITNNRKPGAVSANDFKPEDMPEEEYKEIQALKGDAKTTADFIKAEGGEAEPFFGDVSDYETAGKLVQFAIDTYGRLDILINNAAGVKSGPLMGITEEDWDYQTVPKMKGAFNCMQHAVPQMIKQNYGRILNCASDAWVGLANAAAYSAGNAGIVGLTKASAKELARFGITVNAYCPQANSPSHVFGFNNMIRTLKAALGDKMQADPERMAEVVADHGPAEDMAPFLAYLCTEEAAFVSGSVFAVTASGKIDLYSDPVPVKRIKHPEGAWTVEELIEEMPKTIFEGYTSSALRNDFGK